MPPEVGDVAAQWAGPVGCELVCGLPGSTRLGPLALDRFELTRRVPRCRVSLSQVLRVGRPW
jgi:hypothetical protein